MIDRRIDYWKKTEPRQARFLDLRRQVTLKEQSRPEATYELFLVVPGTARDLEYYRR